MQQELRLLATDVQALKDIMDNGSHPPNDIDPFTLCLALMENFHSTDPVLRDEVSYSLLARLVRQPQLLTVNQRQQLLEAALDGHHLFYRIGERGTDSVFMRGFSVLMIPLVLEGGAVDQKLPADIVHSTTARLLEYAKLERDFRGYVPDKGWAHTAAHTSDALDTCAQHPATTADERRAIMDCIGELATVPDPLFLMEDDRLAFAAHRIIMNELVDEAYLTDWLQHFQPVQTRALEDEIRYNNGVHFLRSLYFILLWRRPDDPFLTQLSMHLRAINPLTRYGMLD
jgi:hypothetical protein